MTTVSTNPISNASPTSAGTANNAAATKGTGGDFETFLKMLTTQIKNQDPLNPMEGSDFAVQLATFSGVEQQVRTNDLLLQLTGGESGLGRASEMIGKEVRTTAPVQFDGAALTLTISHPTAADKVELVTRNSQGAIVSRESIGPGQGDVDWIGKDASGKILPTGQYSFSVESWAGEKSLGAHLIGAYGRVTGATSGVDGPVLTLVGGGQAKETDITGVRQSATVIP